MYKPLVLWLKHCPCDVKALPLSLTRYISSNTKGIAFADIPVRIVLMLSCSVSILVLFISVCTCKINVHKYISSVLLHFV